MTTTHTVREWLEQLPEPYRTQALTQCEDGDGLVHSMGRAIIAGITWTSTDQGYVYWSEAYHLFSAQEFQEGTTNKSPLSDLLDPSEGWTQEGKAFANEHGDSIQSRRGDGTAEVFIILGEKAPYELLEYKCPTVLSAMAMVNQYRREQWQ